MESKKYYHNDFKKIMGIDESLSASQKILDRHIKVQFQQTPEMQPRKKIRQQKTINNGDILDKIHNNLQSRNNKLLKYIQILNKLVQTQQVVSQNKDKITLIFQKLLTLSFNGSLAEKREFYSLQSQILIKIKQYLIQKQTKIQLTLFDLNYSFCNLFTDDSFSFSKNLKKLKQYLSNYFKCQMKQSKIQEYINELILKLFQLPYQNYEWLKSALGAWFRQFTIEYKDKLNEQTKKQYLQMYSKFCTLKSNSNGPNVVDILGKGIKNGAKISVVQKVSGQNTWVKRQ